MTTHRLALRTLLFTLTLALPIVGRGQVSSAPTALNLTPGLYVSVIDGAFNLTNKGGSQNFSAGQFGYTANITKPPVVVPSNPGLKFTPPATFSSPNVNTPGGKISSSNDCVYAVSIAGGEVTVSALTGELTFTPTNGTPVKVTSGQTAQVQGGQVTALMSTTDALKSNNSAFAQVTQQSLLATVAAVAAIAKSNPANTTVGTLLTNLVTEVTKQAASSGNAALVQNVVAFAVANAPAAQQQAITTAANTGVQNSTAADKGTLVASVTSSANAGAAVRTEALPQTSSSLNLSTKTTVVTSVDPSQVVIVSKSN